MSQIGSLSKAEARSAVDELLGIVGDALARGERVYLPGLGAFSLRSRPARRGRNPRTGERIDLPASKTPHFKAAKALSNTVR